MNDRLDEITLIIVDDNFNLFQWFARCNPISIMILLIWFAREIWCKIRHRPNIISKVEEIQNINNLKVK
jgi:hypothetical protein